MKQKVSQTHLVLIPSFNPGIKVKATVSAAREQWNPVWVVVDGSTDNSTAVLQDMALHDSGLKVIVLASNQGKGAAVLEGATIASAEGYTHILAMDSDGQHPADLIETFMQHSQTNLAAMVLGKPVFAASAPKIRVYGRRISNWWTNLETLWHGIGDSLFGFRVYPIAALTKIMNNSRHMRRFDFDVELVVRLCWLGVPIINIDSPVKYFTAAEGGVSHFKYGRDNVLLTRMHIRLFVEFMIRFPLLLVKRLNRNF